MDKCTIKKLLNISIETNYYWLEQNKSILVPKEDKEITKMINEMCPKDLFQISDFGDQEWHHKSL